VSTGGAPSASGSASRQQPGCWSNFSHHAHGTKGFVSFDGVDAVVIQLKGSQPKRLKPGRDGHQTEWDDLLAAVVANRPYNELDWAADSTMTAILDATPRSSESGQHLSVCHAGHHQGRLTAGNCSSSAHSRR